MGTVRCGMGTVMGIEVWFKDSAAYNSPSVVV